MYKFILVLLFAFQISYSQDVSKTSTYKYGHDGMELIISSCSETIIVSTFNSKVTIKKDIADKIYDLFRLNTLCTGDILTVLGKDAKVIGRFELKKKGKLTSINFYYQTIEWNSGLTEIYKKV